ncbi:hypothetical protein ACF08E_25835 [Streptomyces globisporus]|uniref:hypothetical protein n=1 Tax=Streptomyces globisporus TaxID=1908 RepID=UPI0036FF5974
MSVILPSSDDQPENTLEAQSHFRSRRKPLASLPLGTLIRTWLGNIHVYADAAGSAACPLAAAAAIRPIRRRPPKKTRVLRVM